MATRVAVIGTGYVGLTTGACLSHIGHEVACADIDAAKVELLSKGRVPILERELEPMVEDGLREGRLRFVLGATAASQDAEFHFLCLPTPQGPNGDVDLSYLEAAAREIGPVLPPGSVVINKSTVPVGATRMVAGWLGRDDVYVVSNPEFLREGTAVRDFLEPDRIVIGAEDENVAMRVASLYAKVGAPFVITNPASAEIIKYASNAFLATKLSFVNAIAALCETLGADVDAVTTGMGYDKRIGASFLKPGPGWGGSCFPKDVIALSRIAEDAGYDFRFLDETIRVNEEQFERTVEKVREAIGGDLNGVQVAAWGLTFKAGTDDLRQSPAIHVLARLAAAGARIRAFDPAVDGPVASLPEAEISDDAYQAVEDAEVLVVLTEWDDFRWLNFDKVGELMAARRIVDTRNLLDRPALERRGFVYRGIGR